MRVHALKNPHPSGRRPIHSQMTNGHMHRTLRVHSNRIAGFTVVLG